MHTNKVQITTTSIQSRMNKSFWTEKIHLKNLSFPRFIAAPMDGITDSPLRKLIREFSPTELLFGEMRHVSCVANQKSEQSLQFDKIEQPLAFQVSANSTEFMEKAVRKIIDHKFVMLNLNSGCPAKNVIKSGSGSALMANPDLLKKLLLELQKHVNNAIPLTLKIRAGFKEKNGLEIAQLAQDCGVEMLIIHPRLQTGAFCAPLDYYLVKKIKKTLSIPIVFSGNIYTSDDAIEVYEKTGVDGFMVGRGLWGSPWKIREIVDGLAGKKFIISKKDMIRFAIKHISMNVEFYGPSGAKMFKKQLPQYIKGLENAASIRRELLRLQGYDAMKKGLEDLL